MTRFLSILGFFAFVGLSGLHGFSLWHVANHFLPGRAAALALLLALLWLGALAKMIRAVHRNRLRAPLLAVFLYVTSILLLGTRVLEGMPARTAEDTWEDPHHQLTVDAQYVLHNHGKVIRVLAEVEYRLFQTYIICYFSAALMLFAAGLWVGPLDHDGQLRGLPRVSRGGFPAESL